ncbi:hypothetical protein M378DRAFT_640371 [Amanita muscaria Koide BX008]|uniref:Uncharacterized protein n=1 Tax=Amanita muscaria (strain Koide BX008) TaxID=946122 RepID=A0A0C2SMS0_AMAMK|nr:hypothetical protein M378DRAFT_740831 [Amanita muscaria Koide BX008]KIL55274.1 hypothetical protein M378DRAFT_640371 [Amanita muscaria Koide BX008]
MEHGKSVEEPSVRSLFDPMFVVPRQKSLHRHRGDFMMKMQPSPVSASAVVISHWVTSSVDPWKADSDKQVGKRSTARSPGAASGEKRGLL